MSTAPSFEAAELGAECTLLKGSPLALHCSTHPQGELAAVQPRARLDIARLAAFDIQALTALLLFVYLPEHGSMLLPARALGKYDPQLVKPPPEYRGADSVRMFVLGQVLVVGR